MDIEAFISKHWVTVVWTYIINYGWSAFAGAFPAPTAQSSTAYKWWFKFANNLGGNPQRARNTSIESSPNWEPAVRQVGGDPNLKP
jgi:hypothetical protein